MMPEEHKSTSVVENCDLDFCCEIPGVFYCLVNEEEIIMVECKINDETISCDHWT